MFRKNLILTIPILIILLCINNANSAAAEQGPLPHASELTGKLGWSIEEALSRLGAPGNIFSSRGRIPEEDNVVFYYSDHLYIFWFQDRIWQVRFDEEWAGEVDGVRMGMTRSEIVELWGVPINDNDEQPTWTLPDRGYPVRIRLYFNQSSQLSDLYVYRSDW